MMLKALVFDIRGRFAHFKTPESTRESISFPFPSRTALVGLIAAVLGFERNTYWAPKHPLASAAVAIEILSPLQRIGLRVCYQQTKNPLTISGQSVIKPVTVMVPRDPLEIESEKQRGSHALVRLDYLKDVHYRVFFHSPAKKLYNSLLQRLQERKFYYPPYLGHANLLAEIDYRGEADLTELPEGVYSPHSLVSTKDLAINKTTIDSVGYSLIYGVPMSMTVIGAVIPGEKITTKRVVLSHTASLFLNFGYQKTRLKAWFKERHAFEATLNEDKNVICFLPTM